jgi:argininosuccinate lyase
MLSIMLDNIQIKQDILKDEKYLNLFTVELVNDLVRQGVAFRDAYQQVSMQVENGTFEYAQNQLQHTHEGSIGNLCNAEIKAEFEKVKQQFYSSGK